MPARAWEEGDFKLCVHWEGEVVGGGATLYFPGLLMVQAYSNILNTYSQVSIHMFCCASWIVV